MADEVRVIEGRPLRSPGQAFPVPPIAEHLLSIDGAASAAFNPSVKFVRVITSVACNLDFGSAPTGAGVLIPIEADVDYDFDVVAGHKVIAVS